MEEFTGAKAEAMIGKDNYEYLVAEVRHAKAGAH